MIKCQHKTCKPCNFEGYEAEDIRFLYEFIAGQQDSVFFDIGAHVGLYIYTIDRMLKENDGYTSSCKMIAVEPELSVQDALQQNIAPHQALHMAAWNMTDCLWLSKEGREIGRMREQQSDDEDVMVVCTKLDLLANIMSFPNAFAAKIDVEGAEHRALIGLREILTACKSGALVVELSNDHLDSYGSDVLLTVNYLAVLGFEPVASEETKIAEACNNYKRNVHFVKG